MYVIYRLHYYSCARSFCFSSYYKSSSFSCFQTFSRTRITLRFSVNFIFLYLSSNFWASFCFLPCFLSSRSCSFFALTISSGRPSRLRSRSKSLICFLTFVFRDFFYILLYLWNSPSFSLFFPDWSCIDRFLKSFPLSFSSSESTEGVRSDLTTTSSSSLSTRSFRLGTNGFFPIELACVKGAEIGS